LILPAFLALILLILTILVVGKTVKALLKTVIIMLPVTLLAYLIFQGFTGA